MLGLLGLVSLLFLGAGTWLLRQPLALEGSLCFDLKPGAAGPQLQKVLKAQSGPAERFALRLYLRLSGVEKRSRRESTAWTPAKPSFPPSGSFAAARCTSGPCASERGGPFGI